MECLAFALGVFLLALDFWDLFETGRRAPPDARLVSHRPVPGPRVVARPSGPP